MKLLCEPMSGLFLIKPQIIEDNRGSFFEVWNLNKQIENSGIQNKFVQENYSISKKNVIRGLGYQINRPQGKLVRVCNGKIYDVTVDLRQSSKTFGRWYAVELSSENRYQLWIPPGFAHGFLVKSEIAEVAFSVTDYYVKELDRCIIWNDMTLNIEWNLNDTPIISSKDQLAASFVDAEYFK